jgi:hypothetical protein
MIERILNLNCLKNKLDRCLYRAYGLGASPTKESVASLSRTENLPLNHILSSSHRLIICSTLIARTDDISQPRSELSYAHRNGQEVGVWCACVGRRCELFPSRLSPTSQLFVRKGCEFNTGI